MNTENKIKHFDESFFFPIDIQVSQLIFYPNKEFHPGYLHLLEHMIIRHKQKEFKKFETDFNIYNAMTDKKKINFLFIHHTPLELPVNTIIPTTFSKQNFELEKKIILEERKLYPNEYPLVDDVLGSIEQIKEFDLLLLQKMIQNNQFSTIRLNYSSNNKRYSSNKRITHHLDLNNIKKNSNTIILENNMNAEIIVYFLRILTFAIKNFTFRTDYRSNQIVLTLTKPLEIDQILKNKSQILKKYKLFLEELRFHNQEVVYLLEQFNCIPNFNKLWEEQPWEKILF